MNVTNILQVFVSLNTNQHFEGINLLANVDLQTLNYMYVCALNLLSAIPLLYSQRPD